MQTRKKVTAGNSTVGHASPKFCRNKKVTTFFSGKAATELITSSARKLRSAGVPSRKSKDVEATEIVGARDVHARDENQNICTGNESSDHKQTQEGADRCGLETIFSPNFHVTKNGCVRVPKNVKFMEVFEDKDNEDCQAEDPNNSVFDRRVLLEQQLDSYSREKSIMPSTIFNSSGSSEEYDLHNTYEHMHFTEPTVVSSCDEECDGLRGLSPEASSMFQKTQNSGLECVDEPCQAPMPLGYCDVANEDDDFDDFDPYLFIRNLPDLSAVVPTFRSMLLPKQTRSCPSTTLVLDLDETLVHSSLEYCEDIDFTFPVNFNQREHTVYVRCRPCLKDFLERVSSLFEVVVFTASQSIYGEQLLNVLDPRRRLFRHRVYRDSCVFFDGNYLKDLSVLGRDLARVVIIDNSPQAFGFQVDNGIPIESWFDDHSDRALLSLLPFLESLVGAEDVRPLIAKEFNVRGKIAAASCPSLIF